MHVAARDGHLKVAEWLGQRGFSSTPATSSQLLPIHVAASSGHVDVTRWLSRDVSATARGNITPLHMAALNGHSVVAQSLLALQAEPLAAASGLKFRDHLGYGIRNHEFIDCLFPSALKAGECDRDLKQCSKSVLTPQAHHKGTVI